MKHGDIVIPARRFGVKQDKRTRAVCVALYVSSRDIRFGFNAIKPGLYLFRGYWYGYNPKCKSSYGKIEGRVGTVIGTVRNHAQIKSLGV